MKRTHALLAAVLGVVASPALAASFTLTSGNSSLGIDDRNGITTWFVDGRPDNIFLSNYYYRLSDGPERPLLVGLGAPAAVQSAPDRLALTFTGAELTAVLAYELVGGAPGSNTSRLAKSLSLTNTGAVELDLRLFDYTDFDIRFSQASQRDQAVATGPGRIVTTSATQPLQIVTEVTGAPDGYQIDGFFALYTKFFLDQDGPTTLDNIPGFGQRFPVPPGDNAFALQWNELLSVGETFTVAHASRFAPVPEPEALALLALGCAGLGLRRGRA